MNHLKSFKECLITYKIFQNIHTDSARVMMPVDLYVAKKKLSNHITINCLLYEAFYDFHVKSSRACKVMIKIIASN